MELKEYLDELNKLNEAQDDYEYDKKNISFTKYDNDLEYAYSKWAVVKSKTVEDKDGEKTKLVWYYRTDDPLHLFMLGDPETTEPNEDDAEFTTESITEARRFFKDYGEHVEESLKEDIEDEDDEYYYKVNIDVDINGEASLIEPDNGEYVKDINDFDFVVEEILEEYVENVIYDINKDKDYISKQIGTKLYDTVSNSYEYGEAQKNYSFYKGEYSKYPLTINISFAKRINETKLEEILKKYINFDWDSELDPDDYGDVYGDEFTPYFDEIKYGIKAEIVSITEGEIE